MKNLHESDLFCLINESTDLRAGDPGTGTHWEETPGHGYLICDNAIIDNIPSGSKSTQYSRQGRYEEDIDWSIPVCANLSRFNRSDQEHALTTLYHWHPRIFKAIFSFNPIDSHELIEEQIEKDNAHRYRKSTGFGDWHENVPTGYVGFYARRGQEEIGMICKIEEYQNTNYFDKGQYPAWCHEVGSVLSGESIRTR